MYYMYVITFALPEAIYPCIDGDVVYLCLSSEHHGKHGPLAVSFMQGTPLLSTFLMAALDLGIKQVDYNSGQQLGQCSCTTVSYWKSMFVINTVMFYPNLRVYVLYM